MHKPSISYAQRDGTTPQAEVGALAAIYKLCLSSRAKRSAAGRTNTDGDDAKGSENVSRHIHSTA